MKLFPSRTAQWLLAQEFLLNFNNWSADSVDGAKKTFGSTPALSTDPTEPLLNGPVANTVTLDCITLPAGAVITGGEVVVETAFVGPTAVTVSVGVAGNLTALANAVDGKAVGRTALALTAPLLSNAGQNVRLTFTYTVANATAGRARVRLQYTVDGRANETQIA